LWIRLPSGFVIDRALARPARGEQVLAVREGINEVIAVTERRDGSRRLLTNGHPMSATNWLSQRYMRALAHIPLLAIDAPETVLVIGFGVGNTAHAASLHPSIRRVDVADLSRDILTVSSYFEAANGGVLRDPRIAVYVNDGRQHLQMQPEVRYDLIVLEPPPIGYAGVASLYSKEFYELARSHLTGKGYISQWLPAYQVPGSTTLAMVRAFVDVFPEAVLVSGSEADLLLFGTNESRIEIDPGRVAARLAASPEVRADLQRLALGTVREIAGTFVGSAKRLIEATRDDAPVTDDRPIQEYGVKSLLNFGEAVPGSIVDLAEIAAWCPKCFVDGQPVPLVDGLPTYLALLGRAYAATPAQIAAARSLADRDERRVDGSAYLGAIVPETVELHNFLGITYAENGKIDKAVDEFRKAAALQPDDAATHWHLGAALAQQGTFDEALRHLTRSVELDPTNIDARRDLDAVRQRRPGR
jgi:spermidine synthase